MLQHMVYTIMKDVDGYNDVPDLTQAIYDYLKKLEDYGYPFLEGIYNTVLMFYLPTQ